MNISIVNALWSLITGERLEIEDPSLTKLVSLINEFILAVQLSDSTPLALILPRQMTKWPVLDSLSGLKLTKDAMNSVLNLITPCIENHQKTLDPNNIRDFLDLMLVEVEAQSDQNSCFWGELGKITVANSLLDLFVAGMETTASSLVMAILLLLHHPEVQTQAQEEIDKVS
jgi:cytochrome P450 family 2 subfamily U polypeptide 1